MNKPPLSPPAEAWADVSIKGAEAELAASGLSRMMLLVEVRLSPKRRGVLWILAIRLPLELGQGRESTSGSLLRLCRGR